MATIEGIKIANRLSVSTIRAATYHTVFGKEVVDIQVGILPKEGSMLIRRWITVPAHRLLNGDKPENIRTARYSVLMNIINAYAEELWNLDFSREGVVFLGFGIK